MEQIDLMEIDAVIFKQLAMAPGMRVAIVGGPRTGKTTFADRVGLHNLSEQDVKHSDDLIDEMEWSEVSDYIAKKWLTAPGPWCVEGVAIPRALRKWLAFAPPNNTAKPCDVMVYLPNPHVPLVKGQETMRKAVNTVIREIVPELTRLGVRILEVEL
jgi:hypothetical protein